MLCLLTRRPLVVSLSHRAASRCLITPVGCRIIISRRPLVASPSCPLIVLAGCCIASPCAALSSSSRSPSPTPLNAVERCCRHQIPNNISESFWENDPPNSFELNRQILSTTPPPPPLKAVSIVHRCHSCRPSPPSYDNAHLHPSPPSNAYPRRRHPPPLMSISIIASSSPFRSPRRRHRQMLSPQLNKVFIVHRHRRHRRRPRLRCRTLHPRALAKKEAAEPPPLVRMPPPPIRRHHQIAASGGDP
jgi:hypothetical protein